MCFSGALHLVMIVMLLAVPASTARREPRVPVYTVDLVAGVRPAPRPELRVPRPPETKPAQFEPLPLPEDEELEEARLEPAVPEPPAPLKEEKQAKKPPKPKKKEAPPVESVKKAPPEKPKKKVAKPKKTVKPKKTLKPKKVVKRKKPAPPKAAAKKKARKKPAPKSPAKVARKPSKAPKAKPAAGKPSQLVERLRQRRMDDAVATARERARLRREARVGQGSGAAGGAVRGMEFLVYYNRMLNLIKDRWTWIGKRKDLEVTVGFGVGADGEIFGLKLLRVSGDVSYDESVVRAVRRVSPLPPPPPSYARDFADVEVTFRPHDLDG